MDILDITKLKLDDPKFKEQDGKKFDYIDQVFEKGFNIKKGKEVKNLKGMFKGDEDKFYKFYENMKQNKKKENNEEKVVDIDNKNVKEEKIESKNERKEKKEETKEETKGTRYIEVIVSRFDYIYGIHPCEAVLKTSLRKVLELHILNDLRCNYIIM
jgi:hypothetical protein